MRLHALLLVAIVLGCEARSDDELRALADEVAAGHVAAVKDAQALGAKKEKEREQELADLGKRVAELEVAVGAAQARAEELARAPKAPTPEVVVAKVERFKIPIGEANTRGPDTALVTVMVWSDFECPHCGRIEPTLARIETEWGSDVRIAFKHCPLSGHARAKPAAIAAEAAAEQGKFWEMHDKLFANMTDLTDKNFVVWAKELKLDVKRFETDLGDAAIAKRVDDQKDECTTFGIAGVPSFFINGRAVEDNAFESLQPVIDEEKKAAEALVASGTSRASVYETTIASGKTGA